MACKGADVKRLAIAIPTALILFLFGCGSGNNSSSVVNIAGNWSFTGNSTKFGDQFTATGAIVQTGSSVSGALTLEDDPCATTASFSGSVSGSNLSVQLNEGGQEVSYTGTITDNGSAAGGTYTAPAGGCTGGDTGTWSGTRTSAAADRGAPKP